MDLFANFCARGLGPAAGDFGEHAVGAYVSDERPRVTIVLGDVLPDRGNEPTHAREVAVLDAVLGDVTEDTFDEVQPQGADGCEVHADASVADQQLSHFRVLAGRVVARDQVQRAIPGSFAIHLAQELQRFCAHVVLPALADGLPVEHVQRRDQRLVPLRL